MTFRNFKHNYNRRPFSIVISCQARSRPVDLLSQYLAKRGNHPGPLFITEDGLPVSRSVVSAQLSMAISFCGVAPSKGLSSKGHSFRIGAASHAADQGFSEAQIRLSGRWKSNAFQKYIRLPSLSR